MGSSKFWWVIKVGGRGGYGSFLTHGTSVQAEMVRAAKAKWEAEPAWKFRCDSETSAKLLLGLLKKEKEGE